MLVTTFFQKVLIKEAKAKAKAEPDTGFHDDMEIDTDFWKIVGKIGRA